MVFDGGVLIDASNAASLDLVDEIFEVTLPSDGSTVISPSLDIAGVVGDGLSGTPGLSVTVNGTPAQITSGSGGASDTFLLANFELGSGTTTLLVEVTNTAGATESESLTVTLQTLATRNVVSNESHAFASRGGAGFVIVDLETRVAEPFPAPTGSASVDDLSLDGDLLFVLDAVGAGRLTVLDVSDLASPVVLDGPRPVQVGPFTGVSARSGRVVVSGGTSLLQVFSYNAAGVLGSAMSTVDLGVGQPDVLVSSDGERAYVSTDFGFPFPMGQSFGITTLGLLDPPTQPQTLARTGLAGAGFTAGGVGPANFAIESAELSPTQIVTAHGGGLSLLNAANGALLGTSGLGFAAVNVDAIGDTAFVVGGIRLRAVDFSSGVPALGATQIFPGGGSFTGIAASPEFLSIAAGNGGLRILRR